MWGPLDRPLETADGHIVVDATEDGAFRRLALCEVKPHRAGGLEDETALADAIRAASSARWEQALCEAGIPCAVACSDLASLTEDPNLAALFEPLDGGCRAPAAPWRSVRTPPRDRHARPADTCSAVMT